MSGTWSLLADPLGLVVCKMGPPWIRLVPAHPIISGCLIGYGSREFEGPALDSFCCMVGYVVLLVGHCHLMSFHAAVYLVFSGVHKCQEPQFPSRTLHCNKMINVIHLSCQSF